MAHGICSFPTSLLICVVLTFSQFRIDKKFYERSTIVRWAILIYESLHSFPEPAYEGMVRGFLKACDAVGQYLNVIYIFLSPHILIGLQGLAWSIATRFINSKTAKAPSKG